MNELNIIDEIFEDEYLIVKEILGEITSYNSNYSKRVQLVQWKNKNGSALELDFRRYNQKENKYYKGISFTKLELSQLISILEENLAKLKELSDSY